MKPIRWKILLCCGLFALCAISVFVAGRIGAQPSAVPSAEAPLSEVMASELALRDGRLYAEGADKPFTGAMIERYADGALKSRSAVIDGKLHGVSEGWHTNGQMEVREFFAEGFSHGLREKWRETGVKLSESTLLDGQHHGIFRRWHENGLLAEEISMNHGKPDGLARSYYSSGCIEKEVTLSNGAVVEEQSWEDGQRIAAANPQ